MSPPRLGWKRRSPSVAGRRLGASLSWPQLIHEHMRTPICAHVHRQAFERGNAETWGESQCCDMATVMYNMHEMPSHARLRVLLNAQRIARRSVLVVDIWPVSHPRDLFPLRHARCRRHPACPHRRRASNRRR